jgi:hypothetical protein
MLTTAGIEPAERPDEAQKRDALGKGLGRAVLWARAGRLTRRDVLLQACLEDQRFDRQIEEARGPWLWEIMEAVGAVDEFREPILAATQAISEDAAVQLCQFCVHYARRGDERFRRRLREIVGEQPVPDYSCLGEEELIDLEPEAGLLLIARRRGSELLARQWAWEDQTPIDCAIEKIGFEAVAALLDREARTSADVARFRDRWQRDADERNADLSRPGQSQTMSLADAIREAQTSQYGGRLRGWGRKASEGDLQAIFDRLLAGGPWAVIANYLSVFSGRALPEFDQRLLGLLDHEDAEVRRRAFTAVAQNTHTQIRRFALDHAAERINEPNFLELLVRNFRPGDEELLMRHLSLPADDNERHWLLRNLREVLRENPEASCRELALVAYAATPCGECRTYVADLLVERRAAPAWLVEECRHDAVPETRKLVLKSP